MWDDALAREAEEWAKYCRYERPPKYMYDCGSNLFYQRKYVHSWHSIRSNVRKGLQSWSREQQYFRYGKDCGLACAYVQVGLRCGIACAYVQVGLRCDTGCGNLLLLCTGRTSVWHRLIVPMHR